MKVFNLETETCKEYQYQLLTSYTSASKILLQKKKISTENIVLKNMSFDLTEKNLEKYFETLS